MGTRRDKQPQEPRSMLSSSAAASSPSPARGGRAMSSAVTRCLLRRWVLPLLGTMCFAVTTFSLIVGHRSHSAVFGATTAVLSPPTTRKKEPAATATGRIRGDEGLSSAKIAVRNTTDAGSGGSAASPATNDSGDDDDDPRHERSVFRSIIDRVDWSTSKCESLTPDQRKQTTKTLVNASDVQLLPEGGVAAALRKWLSTTKGGGGGTSDSQRSKSQPYGTCRLPPPKSCNATTYTLVLMSHNTDRLDKLMGPLGSMIESWPGLTEVILVWNSPRISLLDVANGKVKGRGKSEEIRHAATLVRWAADPEHPLRIFFSLEEGLTNDLLNRYHPAIAPQNEAVMYFDDDGPFWSAEAMAHAGFELWKRNSGVQVGAFPRNVRFLSKRMTTSHHRAVAESFAYVTQKNGEGVPPPAFTPTCRNVTGDIVEYNYFVFPDFDAHVLLPSGTLLHRNFLCFVWHPAFEELRKFVERHPTHADDMTVSTLVSHLAGHAPRTFPKDAGPRAAEQQQRGEESGGSTKKGRRMTERDREEDDEEERDEWNVESNDDVGPPAVDQRHRRLLWKQKNWGPMREEAVNSILGYFGSIHPGTVGWCAGTPYMKKNNRGVSHVCQPEKPSLDLIPWLNEGGLGFDQCP